MATLIEVTDCSHDTFSTLRAKLIEYNRFGLMNAEYDRDQDYARFWMHDAKYIPLWMYAIPNVSIYVPEQFMLDFIEPIRKMLNEQE